MRLAGDDASAWLLDSESVASVARQMAQTDPRALVRSSITLGNPQLGETEVRDRLEAQLDYCPADAWVARMESYLAHDAREPSAALGDRLWMIKCPTR